VTRPVAASRTAATAGRSRRITDTSTISTDHW
jgi:hypothetical protein